MRPHQTPLPPEVQVDEDFRNALRQFSASFGAELATKMQRLDFLVGDRHWLSVGGFKESLIRNLLRSKLPRRLEVSSGFVLSVRETERVISKQLDVLIWDSANHAPIFRDGEFVIIPPEACRGVVEVKSRLDADSLSDALENLDSLTQFAIDVDVLRDQSIQRSVFAFEIDDGFQFPSGVFNGLHAFYTRSPTSAENRLKESTQPGNIDTWAHYWIHNVAVLNHGVINCQLWRVNQEPRPVYVAYRAESDDPIDAYGFLERSLLVDAILGHRKYTARGEIPGMTKILFANRASVADGQYLMMMPQIRKEIQAIHGIDDVAALRARVYQPRKPRRRNAGQEDAARRKSGNAN